MTLVESIAEELVKGIASKYSYFTVGAKADIKAMIVRQFQAVVPEPQQSLHFTDADEKANAAQCAAIIKLLKERRSVGAANHELAKLAMKYTSRLHDLRSKQHYKIKAVQEDGRNWRYFLEPTDW